MRELMPSLPPGPYPDDWAAVHHIIDEGWMYSLRFDDGVTSAGFLLTPRGVASLDAGTSIQADALWEAMLERYPTIGAAFADATPTMPIAWLPRIQHRLTRATGARWALLPHAYAFVDPLFSTGIAWGLRAVERLGLMFEDAAPGARVPDIASLDRYACALSAEADQIDTLVAGAYDSMAHFDLFAAQAMLYFATVSFAEVGQRIAPDEAAAWRGFLGVGDPVLEPLPAREPASVVGDHARQCPGWYGERAARVRGMDGGFHRTAKRCRSGGPDETQHVSGRSGRPGRAARLAGHEPRSADRLSSSVARDVAGAILPKRRSALPPP